MIFTQIIIFSIHRALSEANGRFMAAPLNDAQCILKIIIWVKIIKWNRVLERIKLIFLINAIPLNDFHSNDDF